MSEESDSQQSKKSDSDTTENTDSDSSTKEALSKFEDKMKEAEQPKKKDEMNNSFDKLIEFKNKSNNRNSVIDFEDIKTESEEDKVYSLEERKKMEMLLDKKRVDALKSKSKYNSRTRNEQ